MMTVTVDTLADVVDSNDGYMSLREALLDSDPVVRFHDSLSGGRITLSQGQLNVNKAITITGPGADKMTIDAGGQSRVFSVAAGVDATISGLTITGGGNVTEGGGVLNFGDLSLQKVVVTGNAASSLGGGIQSRNYTTVVASLRVLDSTIDGNYAVGGAGVMVSAVGGVIEIVGSTISNNRGIGLENSVYSAGGGLTVAGSAAGSVAIINSTFSGNAALYSGGIRFHNNLAPTTIVNTTIAHNFGGGVDRLSTSSQVTFHNTIVADNVDNASAPRDINGVVASASSYNLIGVGDGSGLTNNVNGNKVGADGNPIDPLLSPLDFHGGTTKTHVPLPGSSVVDAGGPTSAATPAADQRGYRRVTSRPEPNVTSHLDIGAAELSQALQVGLGITADFNGDGRNDELLFDPVTREINAALGAAVAGRFNVAAWGSLWSDASVTTGTTPVAIPGDFNGDGRDDVLIRTTAAFHVGISDGASFSFHAFQTLPSTWQEIYAGDVDGDGDDELVAWNSNASTLGWQVAGFTAHTGQFTLNVHWGSANLFHEAGARHFIADANGDGREDLVRRTSAGAWGVALSQPGQFVVQPSWSTTWFNGFYDATANKLVADGPLKKIIATFADVYNNVELELYPGLMKGPDATRQTKAGNNWDQAALLEEQLQALPYFGASDVKIASGKVRVSADQFGNLANWLGVSSTTPSTRAAAVYNVLQSSLDANVVAFDSNGNSTTNGAIMAAIEFTHAWVQAYVPTSTGSAWINLDPSWKFKDRQNGIPLPSNLELDAIHATLGTGIFDEYSYLALNPANDRRLPIEFFEDQVLDWLSKSTTYQGSSLAEVAHDGPIRAKSFASLPTGFMDGMTLAANPGVATYNDFASIASHATLKNELTHQVTIRLLKGTTEHWHEDLVVPMHALDTIHVTFASSLGEASDPSKIAAIGSSTYYGRLVLDGVASKWSQTSGQSFTSSDAVTIELLHFAPTRLTKVTSLPTSDSNYVGPSRNDRRIRFSEKPGDVISIGLEANQHSNESLSELQASLLAAVAGDSTEAHLIQDIDLLGSYAIAKYWYDYQRQNDAIAGLMGAISTQSWVGSGRIKAKPNLLEDPTGPAGDVFIDYLAFGMAPEGFGIDLPNTNNGALATATGGFHTEAWQLMGYNSSALEHNIVEEITSAESVSTIKGLQRAFQQNLGVGPAVSGNPTPSASGDVIRVFESRVSNNVRTVHHVYNVRTGGDGVEVVPSSGTALSENSFKNLLASHANATGVDDKLWEFLSGADNQLDGNSHTVTVMATRHRTDVDNWTGAVYIADVPGDSTVSMNFTIVPDGGPSSNGGYSGGVTKAPPPELKQGNFVNASWAGDPVHVANGNMFRDETDIVFPNIGISLDFTRRYNSQSTRDAGLGIGWSHAFSDRMLLAPVNNPLNSDPTNNPDLIWFTPTGQEHLFKFESGQYKTPSSLHGTLTRQGTTLTFVDRDGIETRFEKAQFPGYDLHARITHKLDRNGDGYVVSYAGPGTYAIAAVEDIHTVERTVANDDAWDRKLVFDYVNGHVATVKKYVDDGLMDSSGPLPVAVWTYEHNNPITPTRLVKITYPSDALTGPELNKVTYDYYDNAAGDPPYANGLIKKITEADGAWHTYEYYRNGRTFRVKQGEAGLAENSPNVDVQTFNYNLVRSQTEFTDERGNIETYIHQKNGLLTKQIHADRSQIKSTWGAPDTSEEFLMTSTVDERGAVETFAYYGSGDPAFKKGQLKESTDKHYPNQSGLLTRYDYVQPDVANKPHLVAPSTVVVDPSSVIGDDDYYVGQKLTTTRQYHSSGDALGRLWKTIDAQGNVVEYLYYPNNDSVVYRRGLLKSIKQPAIVDAAGNPIRYETLFDYDAAGNVTKSTTQTVVTAPALPVVIAESTFVYDSMGNVVRSVDSTGVVTESVIDVLGRLRETGFADANAAIDPLDGFSSRFKYDVMGRVRESIDALGRSTKFEYDRQGNVVKQINPDGTSLLHEYDSFGNCVAKTDALGRTTRFVYDSRNRLIQTIRPDGALERVRYDGAGNVVASIDALGNVTTFKYAAAGRLLETKLPDPNSPTGTAGPTTTNKYDKLGNLIETIDPEANVTQFKYDKLGRVVQTQTLNDAIPNRTTQSLTPVTTLVSLTTTDYDAVGNVIESATYDVSQYDASATTSLITDPRAQQTPANIAANKVQVASLRYDALGRPLKTINADNTSTATTYDAAGRVRFQYDELNRVTELRYDQFGRLDKTLLSDPSTGGITSSSPTTTYRYDAVGNRTSVTDPRGFTTQFEYDVFNRVAATVDAHGNRTQSLYDVAGQMVATVDALGRAAYTRYDDRGRAIEQRQADPDGAAAGVAPVTRFRYDAAGRLVEQIDPIGSSTIFEYDRLGRVTKEIFTTSHRTLDSGDPGFIRFVGTPASVDQPSDYGGDSLLISPSAGGGAPEMAWKFDGLEPGAYRVLATWSGQPTATTSVVFRLSDYYNETTGLPTSSFFPLDPIEDVGPTGIGSQRYATGDMLRYENGAWNAWKQLASSFVIGPEGPGSLGVHLTVGNNQPIHADAIRIERIASRSYQYDANGNVLKEIDPLGRETTFAYDELDRLITETLPDPDGAGTSNPLLAPQTTTNYDGYGNVSSLLERRGNATNIRQTAYEYDRRNRRIEEVIDADNGNASVTYLNRTTSYGYDLVGNLTTKIDLPGHPTLERKTSYFYDHLDRLYIRTNNDIGSFITTSVNEHMEVYSYAAAGNLTQTLINPITDQRQVATLNRYDALGQLIETTEQGLVNGQTEKRTSRFQYDAVGNQTAAVDPLHRLSRSEYDRLDRLVKSTDPDPDGAGSLTAHATTFVYDPAGNLLAETNGANETEKYAYDPQGRLLRSEDGRGDVATRRYDAAGNLTQLVDPAGNVTTYAYDGLDRQIAETTTAGARQFYYDGNGDLAYAVDRNGRASRFAYDRLDQLVSERWYDNLNDAQTAASAWSQMFVKTYDDLDRLVRDQSYEKNAAGQTIYRATDSYRYDGLDRVIEHSNQDLLVPAGPHSTGPALHQTYAYAYDASGLIKTREQFIAGQFAASTKSTYNAFGELVRQEDQDVSAASVASAILDFESTDAVFSYLGDGSLASTTRYTDWDPALSGGAGHRNRVQTTYGYDGAGRVKSIAHGQARRTAATWPGNTQLVEFDYAYDAASRISSIETDWNIGLTGLTTRTDETQTFTFDAAGQLVSGTINGAQSAHYDYGAGGNRTSAVEPAAGSNSYTTGASNRITQDSTYTYEYDDEGNLIRRGALENSGYTLYVWDHRNRLVKVEKHPSAMPVETIQYRYNAADDLIYRSVTLAGQSAQVEHYLVENGQRTLTVEPDGDVKRRYGYGPTGELLFDQAFDATVTTPLQSEVDLLIPLGDHQHSTRLVLAHDAVDATYVRQSIDYGAFGLISDVLGANGQAEYSGVVTAFAHHGSLLDAATGLQRKGERWYSPDLGRFVSEDPIQDGANWFLFAGNDPVNYADPSGLSMQGHPLAGGYSGNVTRQPTIRPGNIPANALSTIGTPLGHAVSRGHGTRSEPAPVARPSSKPLTINDFNYSNDLSSITRTVDPLKAMVQQQRTIDAYRADQALSALRGAHAAELTDIAERNAVRRTVRNYEQGIGQVFLGYGDAIAGTAEGIYNVGRHPINTVVGVAKAVAHPIRTVQAIASDYHEKSGSLRGQGAIFGEILTGFATGGMAKVAKEAGLLGKVASKLPDGPGTPAVQSRLALPAPATQRLAQDIRVNPTAPSPQPLYRSIGSSAAQQRALQANIRRAIAEGATDIRVNQQQVNAAGQRVGVNRPDLQYTRADGTRVYIEYDNATPGSFPNTPRGPAHATRIQANDPSGAIELRRFP